MQKHGCNKGEETLSFHNLSGNQAILVSIVFVNIVSLIRKC